MTDILTFLSLLGAVVLMAIGLGRWREGIRSDVAKEIKEVARARVEKSVRARNNAVDRNRDADRLREDDGFRRD